MDGTYNYRWSAPKCQIERHHLSSTSTRPPTPQHTMINTIDIPTLLLHNVVPRPDYCCHFCSSGFFKHHSGNCTDSTTANKADVIFLFLTHCSLLSRSNHLSNRNILLLFGQFENRNWTAISSEVQIFGQNMVNLVCGAVLNLRPQR